MEAFRQSIDITDIQKLQEITKNLAKTLKGGEIFALIGDLGAGKTAFTKLLLKSSGVTKTVTSPTFVLMIPYEKGSKIFYHLDLYRTNGFEEVKALGIEEFWGQPESITLIEWADKIRSNLPKNSIRLYFSINKEKKRTLIIENAPKYLTF